MAKPVIRSYLDLLKFPKYLDSVDTEKQPLHRIITSYHLDVEYPCGLKGCHQPHKEGFLVELGDEYVTNVGWICGNQFGEKFGLERKRYADEVLRPQAIATIQGILPKIHRMKQEISHLADEAAKLSQMKSNMRALFPRLFNELNRRAFNSNNQVMEQLERSKQEIENLQAMSPSSTREQFRYKEELRGTLSGLHVIALKIQEEVNSNFSSKADRLQEINITLLPTKQLLDWEGWVNRFDEIHDKAKSIVQAGNQLFSPASFDLMKHIAIDSAEKAALSKLTAAKLFNNARADTSKNNVPSIPAPMSKKQRDMQKRLAAILRKP